MTSSSSRPSSSFVPLPLLPISIPISSWSSLLLLPLVSFSLIFYKLLPPLPPSRSRALLCLSSCRVNPVPVTVKRRFCLPGWKSKILFGRKAAWRTAQPKNPPQSPLDLPRAALITWSSRTMNLPQPQSTKQIPPTSPWVVALHWDSCQDHLSVYDTSPSRGCI